MTNTELAYFAGFFDGEGCVGIKHRGRNSRHSHIPYVIVTQVRPEVLQKFKAAFGGNIYFTKRTGGNGAWAWQTNGIAHSIEFLKKIHPHLIVKKSEVEVVVDAFKDRVVVRKRGTPAEIINLREAARIRVMGMR